MSRVARRKQERVNSRAKYSLIDVQKAMNIALEMKKFSKGHLYTKNLKDKCVFCGKGLKARSQCPYWFFTFMDRVQIVLINPSFFTDNEIQALWIRNEDEYKEVQFPLNLHIRK